MDPSSKGRRAQISSWTDQPLTPSSRNTESREACGQATSHLTCSKIAQHVGTQRCALSGSGYNARSRTGHFTSCFAGCPT